MADHGTGWEREKRTHFDEIVVNYDKMRPEYPEALFRDAFEYAGLGGGKKALEIGPGTGKATAPFLNAGFDVTGVEAGAGMAAFLVEKFHGREDFRVVVSPFEDAALEEESYDLIYAASAFHWVDAEVGCPKAFRLLKNGGTIALMRYNTLTADGEELYEEIEAVKGKYYYSHYRSKQRWAVKTRDVFRAPGEIMVGFGFKDLRDYGFQDVTLKLYDWARTYSADEYVLHLDTLADHRSLPDGNRTALYAGIRDAIKRHGGHYRLDHVFQLYMGKRPT